MSDQMTDAPDQVISESGRPAVEHVDSLARALASSPVVWRGAAALLGSVALLITRSRAAGSFDEILGLSLVAVASAEQLPRLFGGVPPPWWRSAVIAVIGGLILLWPSETGVSVGLLAAAAIAVYGGAKAVQGMRTAPGVLRRDRLARGAMMLALAIVVALFPEATLRLTVIGTGVVWIFQAAFVASSMDRTGTTTSPPALPSQGNIDRWLEHRPMTRAERDRIDVSLASGMGPVVRQWHGTGLGVCRRPSPSSGSPPIPLLW